MEAAEYDGKIYVSTYHSGALRDCLIANFGYDPQWVFDNYESVYKRLYEGGDLHKQIRHGWFNHDYKFFAWDHYFGE